MGGGGKEVNARLCVSFVIGHGNFYSTAVHPSYLIVMGGSLENISVPFFILF
jgi:hypothetical protein